MRISATRALSTQTDGNVDPIADNELMLGRLVHINSEGIPFISLDGWITGRSESAHTTVDVTSEDIGRCVVVKFLKGARPIPVIFGFLRTSDDAPLERPQIVRIAGQRVMIQADLGVELTCPRAKVTLNREGQVHIEGENVSSRASQHQKIKGGDIQLN